MRKGLSRIISWACWIFLLFMVVFLSFYKGSDAIVSDGVNLYLACVFPALLPCVFFTTILGAFNGTSKIGKVCSPLTSKLFKINGISAYIYLISIISGYPIGAKLTSDFKNSNLLSETEAQRCSALCSTSSPTFTVACVGNLMFRNFRFGLFLFACHLISSLIVGLIFSFYKKDQPASALDKPFTTLPSDNLIYETAVSTATSVLVVGILISIFFVFTEFLSLCGFLNPIIDLFSLIFGDINVSKGFVFSIFECTKGLKIIAQSSISFFTLPLCAFICGFGGISVIVQSLAYLKKAKIKTAPFVLAKLICAVVNFIIGILLSFLYFL